MPLPRHARSVYVWGNPPRPAHVPCKHICAVLLRLVAAIDDDPNIMFGLRCVHARFVPPPRAAIKCAAASSSAAAVVNLVEGGSESY